MGRFSPRPHQLQPYAQGGPAAFTSGLLTGLEVVTGIKDRGKRTSLMETEVESQKEMRDAQMQDLYDRLEEWRRQQAREWDFRKEAPIIAEGPSSEQPQQAPGAETYIPNVTAMPGPPTSRPPTAQERQGWVTQYNPNERVQQQEQGPGSVDPGIERSVLQPDTGAQMRTVTPTNNVDPGMTAGGAIPYIQGTQLPGDRFPRVQVPGGSMLAQGRSYHQGNEALQQAHTEIHGDPMPGTSSALAQGLEPWKPPTQRAGLSWDEWKAREDYKNKNKPKDATTRNQEFKLQENRAEALAASLVGQGGMDMMEALDEAYRQTGIYPDATLVQRTIDANYNRLMTIYSRIGMPPTNWHAQVIHDIAIGGQSLGEALYPFEMATGPDAQFEVQDPKTGEYRVLTPEELEDIKKYVNKYGSVDNRAGYVFTPGQIALPDD